MKHLGLSALLLLCLSLQAGAQGSAFSDPSKAEFASPAKSCYPETWFHFVDGNVDKDGITKDLEAIAASGISGVQFFHGGSFGGSWPGVTDPVYCLSDNWEDILTHTASEARRLGLRFTMQNCPGWSMAGGPWIAKENAMRALAWTRTDITGGGQVEVQLPQATDEPDCDYRELFTLAFPRCKDDSGSALEPLREKRDTVSDTRVVIEMEFEGPTPLRTLVLSNPSAINHSYSYEPGINIKVEAEDAASGELRTALDIPMPMGAWQDAAETFSFALDEVTSRRAVITLDHQHEMNMNTVELWSAARKNSWEMEAGWALRAIPYGSEYPEQDAAAYIAKGSVRDISAFVDADGLLRWDAPAGDWTVLRIGHINTRKENGPAPAEARGWECDKFSPEGVDAHFQGYIGKYAASGGPVDGLLDGMLMDSWEAETQTWTSSMESRFREFTGYELRLMIPALFGYVIEDQRTTAKFLLDWRNVVNSLMVNNFYGRMAENAKSLGLSVQYETAGGDVYPCDFMEYFKHADVPMAEFWHNSTSANYVGSINFKPVRPTASAGHIYGKPRIASEAFTSFWFTWNESLRQLKENANRHFAQGITHPVFHTYTHNPKADEYVPGTSFGSGIGTPFLRNQTWWSFMPSFTAHLARCTYMLEKGRPAFDVLWYIGDDMDHKPDQRVDYMPGYNYDYCNPDVLYNRLSVSDGCLVTPEGLSYNILWYPRVEVINPATVSRLLSLVRAGAVLVTSRPKDVSTLMAYDKALFEAEMDELYGPSGSGSSVRSVGLGKVYLDTDIVSALKAQGFEEDLLASGGRVDWMHRCSDGEDWYFVAAPEGSGFSGSLDVRSSGRVEIWNPTDGSVTAVYASQSGGRSSLELDLAQGECRFVVFDRASQPLAACAAPAEADVLDLSRDWTLSFPSGWGAPSKVSLPVLAAWKDLPLSREARSFSGTAVYTHKLVLKSSDASKRYELSLGQVDVAARVFVNGREVASLWAEPYSCDITSALHKGKNEIRVEVCGTWFNRLAYDASLEESARKTWTIAGPSADAEPVSSGLLGPVTVSVR